MNKANINYTSINNNRLSSQPISSITIMAFEQNSSEILTMASHAINHNNEFTLNSNNNNNDQFQVEENFWDKISDKRVNEYYLLRGGPSIITTIIGAYIIFILSLGPKLMANRQPYKLNKLLLVYNLSLAAANLWLFIQGLIVSNYGIDTWGCGINGGDTSHSPERGIYLGYLFFLTKIIELMDTVFFVLRKKSQQITFLHVFHHSIVPFFCWLGIKLAPGGSNGFFPLVNSFIHVIMYIYYGLSTLGPSIQPYLWWKKHLTTLQMVQFILVMINAAYTFTSTDCKFPILFLYLQASVAFIFLTLFSIFYKNAYRRKEAAAAAAASVENEYAAKSKKLNTITQQESYIINSDSNLMSRKSHSKSKNNQQIKLL